ncbi:MAG: O-antigen ligase family protein, partial [Tissierellia bacterium]|nr:O-antigen ligase family protein [Tissierellia bacterium]
DPNYFSVLQLVSLAYFSRTKKINTLLKSGAVLFIVMSIFASSSKTGLVTLFCYLMFSVVEYLIKKKKKLSTFIAQLFFIILLVATVPVVLSIIQSLTNYLITIFPTFERVQIVFTDFDVALSRGGSGRDLTWKTALEIIKVSPILGIGLGTYSGFAKHFFGIGSIAHNTYLQLTVEWGLLLAIFFFTYLFYVISKAIFSRNTNGELDVILRDILIIFLIGSLAISLNNARPFWLVLGAFMVNTQMISYKKNACKKLSS